MERAPLDARYDGPIDEKLCEQLCDLQTAIACNPDAATCVSQCLAAMVDSRCYAEGRAASLCLIAAGVEALSCVGGNPFAKPGYCEDEKRVLTACLNGSSRDQ